MNDIYIIFEKNNNEYIKILKYYFRNIKFQMVLLSQLHKLEKKSIILFKNYNYPLKNFDENIISMFSKNYKMCYLNADKTIFYVNKDNWDFKSNEEDKNNDFIIHTNTDIILDIFSTSLKYKEHKHEKYEDIGENYNLIYYLYNNLYDLKYYQLYNKKLSIKSIHDFINIEVPKNNYFYSVIIILNKNNINLLDDIQKCNYKNVRYFIFSLSCNIDSELIIKNKLYLLKKNNITMMYYNLRNNLNLIYKILLLNGLSFEYIIFIKNNIMVNFNEINIKISRKKILLNENIMVLPLSYFISVPYYCTNNEYKKNNDIVDFYNKLYWFVIDNYYSEIKFGSKQIFKKYIDGCKLYKLPNNYTYLEKCLMEIKDYDKLLELIDHEIDINTDSKLTGGLMIKKITIAILTEKENTLENNVLNIISNFTQIELLETVSLLIEKTKFTDIKKTLLTKLLSKIEISEKNNNKFYDILFKSLKYNQTKENMISICDSIIKNELFIEKIKLSEAHKKQILFLLLVKTIGFVDDEEILEKVSLIFNKLYNLENITDYNNLLKYNFEKPYNSIFINFLLSVAIKFNSYHKTYNDFIKNREQIKNNLIDINNNINIISKNSIFNVVLSLDQLLGFKIGNFDLSYQGLPSVDIFKLKTEIIRKLCPDLNQKINFTNNNKKIKILFHANMLNRQHSVYKDRHQVIKGLAEDSHFDVYFSTFDKLNSIVKYTFGKAKHILLTKKLVEIRDKIVKEQFDIIVYCEIGMDPISYYMACLRMAKIQCNTWGHSDTSGIDTIDYFFSSKLYELPYEEAQTHYSEKLILQNSLCTSYVNPLSHYNKALFKKREYFGFTNDVVIYFCAQSLFKLNPLFDDYIIQILTKVDNAILVLLDSNEKYRVIERFNNYGIGHKIKFIAGMAHMMYMNLIDISDIFLDVYPFGGCNSSFEAFSLGKVIVTQPSIMINGRFTSGFYKHMSLDNLICNSKEEYVNFAVKLGLDIEYRKSIETLIKSKNESLFLDKETIIEWKNDLIKIYNEHNTENTNKINIHNNIEKKPTITIIIARYNEDLEWTTMKPFNKYKYIVYNKGDNETFNKTHVEKIINLDNVGRCDHTYLYHVINSYDNLSDIIVFFPGSINIDKKIKRAKDILFNIENKWTAIFYGIYTLDLKKTFYNFTLDEWKCTDKQNFSKNPENKLKLSELRPFNKWFDNKFENIIVNTYCWFGIFSIDKRDILQHPKSRYENIIKDLSDHSNPEVGHYVERSWAAIFHPLKYTN